MASEGFLNGCTRWSSKSPRGWSPRMVRWLCLPVVHEVRGTWGMPCIVIRAPARFPCHRVVFADGHICEGFAFGGPDAQRELC